MTYIVQTYDSHGRPFEDDGGAYTASEYGSDAAALKAANEAFDFYAGHGEDVRLLKLS